MSSPVMKSSRKNLIFFWNVFGNVSKEGVKRIAGKSGCCYKKRTPPPPHLHLTKSFDYLKFFNDSSMSAEAK
ncbi:hypothetical protein Phum_PHUM598300 [Pediculus humanus corporis]|uniref:Uncharacterized protein n=1 Tax=Pediculus humanus subsp. corporis TaxID=121224 RepID=E0W2W6_PEDHC|nr:uncharacterized protein Phum_PHUM598300 [Pediculus humanus corporis]EEB19972.1 hypothetical protein Phum_PHUM598300 [Pediculus humanus corporis]